MMMIFMENGYNKNTRAKTAKEYPNNMNKPEQDYANNDNNYTYTIKLPWIPIMGPKLRKECKKNGFRTVFKSSANLKSILYQNKLPKS